MKAALEVNTLSYTLKVDSTGVANIRCNACMMKSFNINDVLNRYCGKCGVFHPNSESEDTKKGVLIAMGVWNEPEQPKLKLKLRIAPPVNVDPLNRAIEALDEMDPHNESFDTTVDRINEVRMHIQAFLQRAAKSRTGLTVAPPPAALIRDQCTPEHRTCDGYADSMKDLCPAVSSEVAWHCSRKAGHSGPHIACFRKAKNEKEHNIAIWQQEEVKI